MIPSIGTPQIHIEIVQPAPERIGRAAMSISNLDNHGPLPTELAHEARIPKHAADRQRKSELGTRAAEIDEGSGTD